MFLSLFDVFASRGDEKVKKKRRRKKNFFLKKRKKRDQKLRTLIHIQTHAHTRTHEVIEREIYLHSRAHSLLLFSFFYAYIYI